MQTSGKIYEKFLRETKERKDDIMKNTEHFREIINQPENLLVVTMEDEIIEQILTQSFLTSSNSFTVQKNRYLQEAKQIFSQTVYFWLEHQGNLAKVHLEGTDSGWKFISEDIGLNIVYKRDTPMFRLLSTINFENYKEINITYKTIGTFFLS